MESERDRMDLAESELIDQQVEEIMAGADEEDEGSGKKKKRRKKAPGGSPSLRERWRGCSRKRKVIIVLVLVVVALVAMGVSRCGGGKKQMTPMVAVMPLAKQPIQEKLSVSGPVSGTESVDVVSNIHAEITAMNVKEGDHVTVGQVLAVIDSKDLEREMQIAQNAYDLAVSNKKEKDKSEALGYEKAVQDLNKALADFDRSSSLYGTGDISQVEMEKAVSARDDAKRAVEGYTVEKGRAKANDSYDIAIKTAEFDLEKKKENLENAQIKSTIDGTVVRVNSKVGQFADKVENDKPIFSIEKLDQLEMEIKVSEYSIGKVSVGQKAVISADILDGETVEGEVTKISPTGEEKGGGSTERVIPITIRIDGKNSKLIAGITAKAEILIRESDSAFTVPATALFYDGDNAYIEILENMKIRRIPVTTGVDGDVIVEVIPTDGTELAEGMQVVTNPSVNLVDGMTVTVMPQK